MHPDLRLALEREPGPRGGDAEGLPPVRVRRQGEGEPRLRQGHHEGMLPEGAAAAKLLGLRDLRPPVLRELLQGNFN